MCFKPEESRLLAWQRLESKHKGEAANHWNWQKPEAPSCRKITNYLSHAHMVNPLHQSDPASTHWTPADPSFPDLASVLPER